MDKQKQSNVVIHESLEPLLKDLKEQTSQTSTNQKKLTGSFNALLKDLKEMASKQNRSRDTKSARG